MVWRNKIDYCKEIDKSTTAEPELLCCVNEAAIQSQVHHSLLLTNHNFNRFWITMWMTLSRLIMGSCSFRHGAYQWNKLVQTCCMKYEIFVWCNKSIDFNGTMHTIKQETFVSWNIFHETLIVLHEGMLRNFWPCCHVFCLFKWKDYHRLHKIYFLSVPWAANMLHAIYLWNMFHAICFIGVHRA